MSLLVSKADKGLIRDAAKEQLERANTDSMASLKAEWVRHNDCKSGRPMVVIEWGTFAQEAIDPLLKCSGKLARVIEKEVVGGFIGSKLFNDDSVVNDYVAVNKSSWIRPFDIKVKTDTLKDSVGHHFHEVITDLGDDFHLLKKSTYGINTVESAISRGYIESIIGDIIPVKNVGRSCYAVPTQDIVHIMSLENIMFSMYDYPQQFHSMMDTLSNDYVAYFKFLEEREFLLPTSGAEWVGQGSYGFTSDLPSNADLAGKKITTRDIWGFMDSQETSTISPDMYEEFIFPYYKRVSDLFGLFSYGCCEPIDPIWTKCISKMENLRKVSISPWCNEEFMGEQLQGRKVVYHRKPSPNYLGVDKVLDEKGLREHVGRTLKAAQGCNIEFTQRDVYTVHNNMDKVKKYVSIIRDMSTK